MKVSVAAMIKEARAHMGMSLRAVEEATGISNAYLSQIESGRAQRPSPRVLHKLSEFYRLSYPQLMAAAGYPVPIAPDASRSSSPLAARFDSITDEEEAALTEYLDFLRSRRSK